MKLEWWYDGATYHYSHGTELVLARLTIQDSGAARILTDGGEVFRFENEEEASIWFLDEEYRRLEDLIADFQEAGTPVDPRIKPPTAASDEELLPQMVIVLEPAPTLAAPTEPNGSPTAAKQSTP